MSNRIYAVAVSPNGRFAAFGGQVDYLSIYDMDAGKEVRRLERLPRTGATSVLTFSPNSRFLASGDWNDGTVRVWELATGRPFETWPGHQGRNFALAFAPDCSVLLSGNEDTTALVWDLTGQFTERRSRPRNWTLAGPTWRTQVRSAPAGRAKVSRDARPGSPLSRQTLAADSGCGRRPCIPVDRRPG